METLVLVMMILVCFSFVLKQTFHGVKEIMIISVLVAFFVGMHILPEHRGLLSALYGQSSCLLPVA